ncbi:pyridoxamine 5'-phosphate oxidase family protein [Streptosporangium sp. NBC_01755]|uniref:pyridoxamine 5'-phosphate oxidase family protein n=1 Tax=unclassified Streptosporangium TaxID=2632669 RepID=UPI002DD839B0|nr:MULTISPECIES: pyridoxamine 5'-phosphate oxidase family protein [unclassified Streptosporangium]WSA26392.1 pyridoxamine 5'-phosphate oxidase family protein [Streptosporangium sp. NBC_01810]WSD02178.1 pyridoxamine 5'-phosphate oxidase family protein [Streptosporangium sp. NBC_01755]
MNQRTRIVMSDDEVTAFINEARKLQLGTINPDGTPHMVTMFYALTEGKISFWTYGKAQKTLNIQRDARVSRLIEAGGNTPTCAAYRCTGWHGGSTTPRASSASA